MPATQYCDTGRLNKQQSQKPVSDVLVDILGALEFVERVQCTLHRVEVLGCEVVLLGHAAQTNEQFDLADVRIQTHHFSHDVLVVWVIQSNERRWNHVTEQSRDVEIVVGKPPPVGIQIIVPLERRREFVTVDLAAIVGADEPPLCRRAVDLQQCGVGVAVGQVVERSPPAGAGVLEEVSRFARGIIPPVDRLDVARAYREIRITYRFESL